MTDLQPPLNIVVCRHFSREAETILAQEGLQESAALQFFSPTCLCPGPDNSMREQLGSMPFGDRSRAILMGGCYLTQKKYLNALPAHHRVYPVEQCFHFLVSREIVDAHTKEGAYLLSPGRLADWRTHISQWGFTQATARDFFHEFTKYFLLLDTGVYPESADTMKEFAEFVDLPFRSLAVGLDHFRLILKQIVLQWQLEQARTASERITRQNADYSMALDLLTRLARVTTENEAIERIMDMFELLFAPQELVYASIVSGRIEKAYSRNTPPPNPDQYSLWLEQRPEQSLPLDAEHGFYLRLSDGDHSLGLIEVLELALPIHRDEYLSVAVSISKVCGLVISNARLHGELQRLSMTDSLTGLNNRNYFNLLASKEFLRSQRYHRPLSVMMMDVDHFKMVNDTHGHPGGDQVLVEVAQTCQRALRASDTSARYGGEEFIFLLPETNLEGAAQAAERIRKSIEKTAIRLKDKTIGVTVSLGIASLKADDANLNALIARSDQALYAAKRGGRNRVCNN